ncbi:MAG: hypothetical protein HFJ75_07315 [Eggerthellaceae bacterium]|nr:hypothetical protein [Eggerthellaceae bacterium]
MSLLERRTSGGPRRFVATWGFFLVGLLAVLALAMLYLLAGGGIPADIHDTLDCEVFSLILQAEAPGSGGHAQFMDGTWTALSLVSPGSLLFYLALPPLQAFALNAAFVLIVAYVGCYACLRQLGVRRWVSACTALLFSLLPFYSVFGLCVMGAPLALLALLLALDPSCRLWRPLALCAVYGLFSSLSQVGFAVLAVFLASAVVCAARREGAVARRVLLCACLLGFVYAVENGALFAQVLGLGDSPVSHRVEFSLPAGTFEWQSAWDFFMEGHYHAPSRHRWALVLMLAALVVSAAKMLRGEAVDRRLTMWVLGALLFAGAIAILHECFQSGAATPLRQMLPASLQSLQLDRFYWLYPALWYVGLGAAAELLLRCASGRLLGVTALCAVLLCMAMTLRVLMPESQFMRNARTMVAGKPPTYVTWDRFFETGLFDQIKADLIGRNGDDDFRVASIGLYPSIPLFNGFSCLDGYSNYYDLDYKHRFREIIAGELEADSALREYFDGWGSRCYVFSHELGRSYLIPKKSGKAIEDLRVDLAAFRQMGGKYLLCGVPIEDPEQYGLDLVGEYATEESYYAVWVYEVEE